MLKIVIKGRIGQIEDDGELNGKWVANAYISNGERTDEYESKSLFDTEEEAQVALKHMVDKVLSIVKVTDPDAEIVDMKRLN